MRSANLACWGEKKATRQGKKLKGSGDLEESEVSLKQKDNLGLFVESLCLCNVLKLTQNLNSNQFKWVKNSIHTLPGVPVVTLSIATQLLAVAQIKQKL